MNENKFEKEIDIENELKHWGILGMHWGIRRYQNPDGSLTPEGRERYLKNPNDKKNESYNEEGKKKFVDPKYFQGNSNKVNMKAVEDALNGDNNKFYTEINKLQVSFTDKASKNDEYGLDLFIMVHTADTKDFNKFINEFITSDDHSRSTLEKYLNSKWPYTFNDSDIDALYEYMTDMNDYISKSYEFLSEQVNDLGISDSKRDYVIDALRDEYIVPAIGLKFIHSDINDDDELKHWGILGMKWGIRNYQNPDGSLTPLGRIRYGVGAAKNKTGNVAGINDANSLSDEELKRMTRRYQQQADYYNARNNYIYQEARFKENTTPAPKQKGPSAVGRFLNNVVVRPLEDVMSKNASFIYGIMGYELLKAEHPEAAEMYFNSITNSGFKVKSKEQKEYEERKKYKEKLDLENSIRDAERKRDDPYYGMKEPNYGGKKGQSSAGKKMDYYRERKSYEDNMNDKFNDPNISNEEIREMINEWKFVYGNERPLNSY